VLGGRTSGASQLHCHSRDDLRDAFRIRIGLQVTSNPQSTSAVIGLRHMGNDVIAFWGGKRALLGSRKADRGLFDRASLLIDTVSIYSQEHCRAKTSAREATFDALGEELRCRLEVIGKV
jgi:hypothetical protein